MTEQTNKLTITLAKKPFAITVPLMLGQLEDVRAAVVLPPAADPQEEVRRDFKRSLDIIAVALAPEYAEMTVEKMRSMRISSGEMNQAVTAILEASGFSFQKKEGAAGEAPAEAKAA